MDSWPMIERCRQRQALASRDTLETRRLVERTIDLEQETARGINLLVQVEHHTYGWALMLKPG